MRLYKNKYKSHVFNISIEINRALSNIDQYKYLELLCICDRKSNICTYSKSTSERVRNIYNSFVIMR